MHIDIGFQIAIGPRSASCANASKRSRYIYMIKVLNALRLNAESSQGR